MSSSTKIDNRKKDILILGRGPTQGLKSTLSAEKIYSINFTKKNTKFCLSLHYNGQIVIHLLTVQRLLNLKKKILKFLHIHYV